MRYSGCEHLPIASPRHRGLDVLITEPAIPVSSYRDVFGNWCSGVLAPPGRTEVHLELRHQRQRSSDEIMPGAWQDSVGSAGRYAALSARQPLLRDRSAIGYAWQLFGGTHPATSACRRSAITFITTSRSIIKMRGATGLRPRLITSAPACAAIRAPGYSFFRCLNIPARYCTGYLGDVGTPRRIRRGFRRVVRSMDRRRLAYVDPRNNVPRSAHSDGARPRRLRRCDHIHIWTEYA